MLRSCSTSDTLERRDPATEGVLGGLARRLGARKRRGAGNAGSAGAAGTPEGFTAGAVSLPTLTRGLPATFVETRGVAEGGGDPEGGPGLCLAGFFVDLAADSGGGA